MVPSMVGRWVKKRELHVILRCLLLYIVLYIVLYIEERAAAGIIRYNTTRLRFVCVKFVSCAFTTRISLQKKSTRYARLTHVNVKKFISCS